MKRRLISLLLAATLAVSIIATAAAINSVTRTDDEIITATMEYLNIKEGNCNSVNANDMGAVSIGMIQWHGTRALNILKQIVALIPDYALEVLGEEFYNEILTAKNWETRIVNAEEKAALILLLSTEESKQVQIAQARADIGEYLSHAKRQGMNTPALQMYFMDIENQYGSGGAERMVRYAKEASGLTQFNNLTEFHNGMRKAAYQLEYDNSVTPHMNRRESTYTYIVEKLGWETDVPYCVMTAPCGSDGGTHQSFEITAGSFTFPECFYTNEGYEFVGWNIHRQPSNTWYIANIGWCSASWIEKQGYTKALYQPGQTQQIDSKFLSSGCPGSAYILEPVWKRDERPDPATCTHDWKETVVTAATCTSGGTVRKECTLCGTVSAPESTLPAGHKYGGWTVLQAATCSASGLRSRSCGVCGLVETDVIAPTAHLPTAPETVLAATCTTEGQSAVKCSLCGKLLELQTIPALGHEAGEIITDQAPTCKTAGMEHSICVRCKTVVYSVELPAQHSFTDWQEYTPATAMGDGTRIRRCTVCGFTELQKIPGGTHVHDYTKESIAPTCTKAGGELYTCGCGDFYLENEIPALGHNTYETATAATCCSDGFSICTCSRCHMTWQKEGRSALGHSWDGGTVTVFPSAGSDGTTTFTCTRCGAKRDETVPYSGTCTGGSACPGSKFTDMPSGWAHAGLDFCVARQLLAGVSDTSIAPNGVMTRAMLVAVLYRLEGNPAVSGGSSFTDVPAGSWYYNAVLWANSCGLVSGVGGGKFAPNASVSREQIATVLFRYAIYKSYDFTATADLRNYPDRAKISSFAEAGMTWAVGAGMISGKASGGKTYLDPLGSATRAEVASILMRLVQNFG